LSKDSNGVDKDKRVGEMDLAKPNTVSQKKETAPFIEDRKVCWVKKKKAEWIGGSRRGKQPEKGGETVLVFVTICKRVSRKLGKRGRSGGV